MKYKKGLLRGEVSLFLLYYIKGLVDFQEKNVFLQENKNNK